MGSSGSSSKQKVPELTREQKQRIAQCYGASGLTSYDHGTEGYILPYDRGSHAYEELKYAQAASTLNSAKNSKVVAASNEAYILPKSLKIENDTKYTNCKIIKFDYKIEVKSTVIITLACKPHIPDVSNPFDYQACNTLDISTASYQCDPAVNGQQNTISYVFNPSDFSTYSMNEISNEFYPCLIHIYAHYSPAERKQNENFIYCSFDVGMKSIKIEKNLMRKDGKSFEMKTVYGMAKDEDGSNDNLCLVCIENPKNIVLKPCSHMCICEACAEPMLRSGQKCPVCRSKIREIEKIDIVGEMK